MTEREGGRLGFARHVHRGELISAAFAVALLAMLFGLEWYGLDLPPGRASGAERVTTETGWQGLSVIRWLVIINALVAIGALVLHISQSRHGASTETDSTVTVLGAFTAIVLTYRVLIDLPSPESVVDQKIGAYLGLLCGWGIAVGGYHSLRTSRERARAAGEAAPADPAPADPAAGAPAGDPAAGAPAGDPAAGAPAGDPAS